jgi:hypothetical protein
LAESRPGRAACGPGRASAFSDRADWLVAAK